MTEKKSNKPLFTNPIVVVRNIATKHKKQERIKRYAKRIAAGAVTVVVVGFVAAGAIAKFKADQTTED